MLGCALQRPAGPEPAHAHEPPAILLLEDSWFQQRLGTHRQRDVELLAHLQAEKLRRRHADDLEGQIVEHEARANGVLTTAETPEPVRVTDHGRACRAATP